MPNELVYLDNAATSFPKPPKVLERMIETYARLGVSPGRGSYDLSVEAGELVTETRQKLADFFGAPDPDRVIFGSNATDALNQAILGVLRPGDHAVSTKLEHNSVLRPLEHLRASGCIEYDLVSFGRDGRIDPDEFSQAIRPNTRLAIITHASNVLGTVQPVPQIARICAARGVPLLVDVAQSAGHVPIKLTEWQVSAIAFTGHKSLFGPSGIGGLVLSPSIEVEPTRFGGTGVDSRSLIQTREYPSRLECGTINLLGVIGLSAGIDYLNNMDMVNRHKEEMTLIRHLREGLSSLPRVVVYSPELEDTDVPVLTCNIEGLPAEDVGAILDGDYSIAVRTGLHCAPLVHAELGTLEGGAVRFSLGHFNTIADIEKALDAMKAISGAVSSPLYSS